MKKFHKWLESRDPKMHAKVIRIIMPLGMVHQPDDDGEMPEEPVSDEPCGSAPKKKVLLKEKPAHTEEPEHPIKKIARMFGLMGK